MDCSLPWLLCLWNFPGKNTGVGYHFFLLGIFPTQGLNPRLFNLLRWQVILYHCATWDAPHSGVLLYPRHVHKHVSVQT